MVAQNFIKAKYLRIINKAYCDKSHRERWNEKTIIKKCKNL